MESSEITTKSSNEILTELFGAFNAEPPKIISKTKRRSSSEGDDSKHSKKSKKKKIKKSKKKHKSKHKKHKRKHEGVDSESDSISVKVSKKKRKEKKLKKRHSPNSVNIELPVNKVPIALEIMLDGTVGIKGEDGSLTKIPDVCESDKNNSEPELNDAENNISSAVTNDIGDSNSTEIIEDTTKIIKTDNVDTITDSKIPEVFETKGIETGDKKKTGKIQIKDLKFSSVFQETVKAVEEQKKREEERKANFEEGELSDSTEEEQNSRQETEKEESKSKTRKDHSRYKRRSRHKNDDGEYLGKRRRSSRSRSGSYHRSDSRHYSYDHSSHKRFRSSSKDHHSLYRIKDSHRRHSPSISRSRRSRSKEIHRSRSRSHRSRSIDRRKSRSTYRSKSNESKHQSKGKIKNGSDTVEKIDKEKLLAIARKNALKLIDAGVVPGAEKLTTIKAGGKTVNELTEYCKKLSEKEALGDDVSDIETESSDDEEKPFHHPFLVKDRPGSIILNIKNSIPLPVKSLQEKAAEQAKQLRLQFPVSSGSSHRRNEREWVPVSPKKDETPTVKQPPPAPMPLAPPLPVEPHSLPPFINQPTPMYLSSVPTLQPFKPMFPIVQPNPTMLKLDISTIVSKRLEAIRKLQENPNDSQALHQMYSAQQEMQYWAESKQETGVFTGSTGVRILSASELNSGAQAWAKRDQLTRATPVRGGMGMALLQKMGWQPGEGLGKNKEGTLEPLRLEVKMDKKGLLAPDETKKGRKPPNIQQGPPLPTVKTLDGKHPVSLLNELCSRRKYGFPQFELCFECGPDHKKNFLFKVKVNGIEYTPTVASPNKKQAKAEAAAICLRALGIISNNTQQN